MKPQPTNRGRALALLLTIAVIAPATLAFAQTAAPQAGPMVFLPFVAKAGVSTQPTTPTVPPTTPTTPPTTPTQPTPQPPAKNGFFALSDWLTYNAATAIDAQGGMHLAFYTSDERHQDEPRNQAAYYAYCGAGTAACADPSKWSNLVMMDNQANEVQIAATADGRPRLLVRRNGSRGYEYDYWACETDCTNAQNWSGLFVTEAAGVDLNSATAPQHSFALDAQGRPRFAWGNGWGNGRRHGLYYTFCDEADCTQLDTWQHTLLATLDDKTVSADYSSLVFDGDKPRFLTRINYSGLPVEVRYYACDFDCGSQANWGYSALPYPEDKQWVSWDLALDAQGRPRVALYEPPGIDITVGGRLFYATCDSDCAGGGTPFQLTHVASGEGKSVDLEIDAAGRTHMVYDAGQRGVLGELWCDAGCADAGAWQRRILETTEGLSADLAPASPLTCDQQERVWFDALPQVSFDAQGKMVVAYDAVNYARCYFIDPADPTHRIYSQVKRIWWGVRLAQFTQP
jgi:hypothetical protein